MVENVFLASQRRFMLETASIAGGATIAVFSAVILCLAAYLRWRRRKKGGTATDEVDGLSRNHHRQPIFGVRPQGKLQHDNLNADIERRRRNRFETKRQIMQNWD